MIEIRKRALTIETTYHEGGPPPAQPLILGAASAVVLNPFAGRYEQNLLPFMAALRQLGTDLTQELIAALGGRHCIEVYGKAAIVGSAGEVEHAHVWHEAGGWAMREGLGHPKAMVPAAMALAGIGYRLMVPVHYIHASFVRSHFNGFEIGIQDAPKPNEILFSLIMGTGGRVHSRLGGLLKEQVVGEDGLR